MGGLKRRGAAASFFILVLAVSAWPAGVAGQEAFRPPSVPLVTSDPYLSIWSNADKLTDDATRHWTKREHSLVSLIRIDGKTYRLMGNDPKSVAAMPQVGLLVLPTRSIYEFDDSHVHVTLTFLTAALPHDLEVLTRPLTYLTWNVKSLDGASHAVSIYDSTSSRLSVNTPDQKVIASREAMGPLTAMRVGTESQTFFQPAGDDTRITWGYAYAAALRAETKSVMGANDKLIEQFVGEGTLPAADDARMPRAAKDEQPVLAFVFDLGKVGEAAVSRHMLVAYDEIYSIKYFGQRLRPYWRRNGATAGDMLQAAEKEYVELGKRCEEFDRELMADMTRQGGEKYAQIAALAYRQTLAATGIAADANKQPLLFTKENTSNGDIATVDVIFPMEPMFLLLSPALTKASLVPIFSYAASDHWKFPNAPHDLGAYPVARGTDDGGETMPVEESGNMILLSDALAHAEGNADFVTPWWPQLTQWAQFLERYGLDPENQLCTDDFMGHLAHNSNLSVKAILALAAYGDLCKMRGDVENAKKYAHLAKADAEHWMKVAEDGGHSRLAFDKPNTWSQKYNLVWDRILGLNVFPASVAQQETAYYRQMMQRYGVPLDSRTKLTKTDWTVWSATMSEKPEDFEAFVSPIYDYLTHTSARSPLVDSYETHNLASDGMHARSVVGGIYVKMLSDPAMWKKWSSGDKEKVGNWAALPVRPKVTEIVATSRKTPASWRYTFEKPAGNWQAAEFDASSWKEGPGGFGTKQTPNAVVNTIWKTGDIWIRREFTMPQGKFSNLQLLVYHDEDVEIYVNGVLAAKENGFNPNYEPMEMSEAARALFTPGAKITLAVHCHQTEGGQAVDVGVVNVGE